MRRWVEHDHDRAPPPDVGDVAPDFVLPDATTTLRRLADLSTARPQVVVFYRGHW
ncbi:MAG: hypothetical protein ABIY55_25430 [Kofleriaceae bacterium]